MSTISAARIHTLTAHLPRWGQWRVEAVLEGGDPPAEGDAVDVDIAGLALVGTVLRSGLDRPERPHVVVVGGIGWLSPIPSTPRLTWQSDGGVRLSYVLSRIAAAAGEPIAAPTDRVMGNHYVTVGSRAGQRALYRDALTGLVRGGFVPGWWVGNDGITRFVERETGDVGVRATPLPARADVGARTFGIDSPAEFMPGRSVEGVTIERAIVRQTPNTLTVECWRAV